MKKQRNILVGGLSLVLMTSVSSVAMAQCTATSFDAAVIGGANLAPFASGGAVNTLISSINAANTAFLTQSTAFVGSPANPAPGQEGGGVWARGIGGEITTNNRGTSTYNIGGVPVAGSLDCNTSTKLSFSGAQVGTDGAKLNWNGWNVHVGTMAGYLNARARDTSAAGVINPLGGTLTNSMEVPFVGVYAAATYGSFFIDGQVRWDYFQNTLNDPIANGVSNLNMSARGLAFTANVGYNMQLGNGWFIEPSAGLIYSTVEVDPFNTPGTAVLGTGLSLPGQVRVGDINSALGRLSLRAGTTIATQTMIWQPFVTASVYHDFKGDVTTTFGTDPAFAGLIGFPVINGTLTTNGLGTYGQFAVGIAGQVVDTGWLGYVRADYRTGDRIDGYSVNGGLRYQFSPDRAPLSPKGLITKAPVLASSAYNWTGFYIGGQFGGVWGRDAFSEAAGLTVAGTTNVKPSGALAGGQIGYDWQIGKWVVGLEGSAAWSNSKGSNAGNTALIGQFFTVDTGMNWLATATGRIGYAFWDRTIAYVKGGYAGGEVTAGISCTFGAAPFLGILSPQCPRETSTATRHGWTIGYGTEFALSQNWTVKGESNYYDLGRSNYNLPLNGTVATVKHTGFNGTIGLNYRFATGGPLR
jgi:opacity protein-like surface antigen